MHQRDATSLAQLIRIRRAKKNGSGKIERSRQLGPVREQQSHDGGRRAQPVLPQLRLLFQRRVRFTCKDVTSELQFFPKNFLNLIMDYDRLKTDFRRDISILKLTSQFQISTQAPFTCAREDMPSAAYVTPGRALSAPPQSATTGCSQPPSPTPTWPTS